MKIIRAVCPLKVISARRRLRSKMFEIIDASGKQHLLSLHVRAAPPPEAGAACSNERRVRWEEAVVSETRCYDAETEDANFWQPPPMARVPPPSLCVVSDFAYRGRLCAL